MTSPVSFDFHVESAAGIEQTWRLTADVTREHGRYFADITSAMPEGETSGYDVSDLEQALLEDGCPWSAVEQAAIDAYVDRATREGERRECDLEMVGT